MTIAYPPIRYSSPWDKLKETRHTTIRNQFSYKPGKPPLDKSKYYITDKLYTEFLGDKPLQNVRLYGLEANVPGSSIGEQLLLHDITLNGVPQMDWYKKIRAMKHALVLHLEVKEIL